MEKTLILVMTEGRREGDDRMRWLDGITNSVNMNLSKFQEIVKFRGAWHAAVHVLVKSQMVKNPPARQETWVQSLDWEDPLEVGMATHSSILVWSILWTEEPGGLQFMGSRRVRHD